MGLGPGMGTGLTVMVIEHEHYRVLMLHRPATCALLQHSTAFCWGFDSLFIYCRPPMEELCAKNAIGCVVVLSRARFPLHQ